jgi:DNA-binding NarL/FixJ family response regulator
MTRVILVDDHAVLRRGMREILEEAGGFDVTGEAGTGAQALELLGAGRCDVLVLDVSLPDLSGLEVTARVVSRFPDIGILILTIFRDAELAVRLLRAGARGFLTKEAAPSELVSGVRRVAEGKRYLGTAIAQEVADILAMGPKLPHERLTNRELEVLVQLARGKALTEIACELHLSAKTVTTHRWRLLQKMGLESNADLVRYALRHRLIVE